MGLRRTRQYTSYQEYLEHQAEKTLDPVRRQRWLNDVWDSKVKYFERKFAPIIVMCPELIGKKALGLGSRTGQEIKAMQNVGMKAVGIDLVPCKPFVIGGDMHGIPFKKDSFSFVFSNSFDHCIYPGVFVSELRRVLCYGGIVLLHIQFGELDSYGVTVVGDPRSVIHLFGGNDRVLTSSPIKDKSVIAMDWEILIQMVK